MKGAASKNHTQTKLGQKKCSIWPRLKITKIVKIKGQIWSSTFLLKIGFCIKHIFLDQASDQAILFLTDWLKLWCGETFFLCSPAAKSLEFVLLFGSWLKTWLCLGREGKVYRYTNSLFFGVPVGRLQTSWEAKGMGFSSWSLKEYVDSLFAGKLLLLSTFSCCCGYNRPNKKKGCQVHVSQQKQNFGDKGTKTPSLKNYSTLPCDRFSNFRQCVATKVAFTPNLSRCSIVIFGGCLR